MNRFVQPDTIIPDPTNPQSLNRYSYTLNNPLKYTDPSGHYNLASQESNKKTKDHLCLDMDCTLTRRLKNYGVEFSGSWSTEHKRIVATAVRDVAKKLGSTTKTTASEAFRTIYGIDSKNHMIFEKGPCPECDGKGAWTHGPRRIEYDEDVPFSSWFESSNRTEDQTFTINVHAVVHELGHAFAGRFSDESPINPYHMVDARADLETDLGYAEEPPGQSGLWRPNTSVTPNETFANMYLGWVYNNFGQHEGGVVDRMAFMESNMKANWLPALTKP